MASILTNVGATAALQTLRSIASNMEDTQGRISSGLRVGSATDNAAYWSIATTMRSDNEALGAVQDALGLGAAKVDTAYAGMEAAIDVVKEIKNKYVAASEQTADRGKIQEEITQLKSQLISIAESGSFNGENWLLNDLSSANKTVVSGFVRAADGTTSVKTTAYTLSATNVLFEAAAGTGGILGATYALANMDATTTDATVATNLSTVEAALKAMTSAGAKLGSVSMRIDLQQDFATKLSDSLEKGIGRLVDADMNEESTKLKALQTQQQLAIQALSIANSDSQNILSLFR
ncbi:MULTISPECIES: flagellin N-terminal helical domain-containing protein [Agrobacterium]|uniref:Flagellin n=1 Tax=Agrobacterium salinitolerans TaxID=1183413 RepID=A0A9X3QYW3_9HYPH|nr:MULTISPECIES: flagellin [Agrobacterium]MBA4777215.1 flagellin [Hyphomicrobiales bacterium]PNQ23615.1 flagellin [Rhizobium sp. YIC5082]MCZ7850624.1 flagellin [Agrobacterium salinitolerans]MCZ7856316.1 flagellin [Agrobacterium salinitolerans]MCZ7885331.1 flagellin [Agrobacterium salinitolerans]